VESSSANLVQTEEGFQPVFFDPRPLKNLLLVDELPSLMPILDMKVQGSFQLLLLALGMKMSREAFVPQAWGIYVWNRGSCIGKVHAGLPRENPAVPCMTCCMGSPTNSATPEQQPGLPSAIRMHLLDLAASLKADCHPFRQGSADRTLAG
jgi:hypothetical protein